MTAFTTQAPRAYQIAAQFRIARHSRSSWAASMRRSSRTRRRGTPTRCSSANARRPGRRSIADFEAGASQPRYDGGTSGGSRCSSPDRRIFEQVPVRVRVGADLARLPDGLLVLLGDGLQRPALPHARDRRRRRGGGSDTRARHHLRRRRPERLLAQGQAALHGSVPRHDRRAARQAVDHAGHDQFRRRR